MSFDAILNQDMPCRLMRNSIRLKRIPNAMLFWGPSGVGKHLAALEFAKAINCTEHEGDSCGTCLSCRKIAHGNHPDIHTVVPVKKSRIIDVDAINGMVELASLRPYEAEWRIFIIQEADRMRGPAQNHILKTLEEPPGKSLFILISEFPQLLLPTIRSRCQMVRFGRLAPETIKSLLIRDREVDANVAESIAAISQGQMSRAIDLLDSDKREVVFGLIERLVHGEDPMALSQEFAGYVSSEKSQLVAALKGEADPGDAKELSKEDRERIQEEQLAQVDALGRRGIMELLYLMETWYRDMLVYSATGEAERVLNQDQLALLESVTVSDPSQKIGAIEKARLYLERFLNEERVFRDLFFALSR